MVKLVVRRSCKVEKVAPTPNQPGFLAGFGVLRSQTHVRLDGRGFLRRRMREATMNGRTFDTTDLARLGAALVIAGTFFATAAPLQAQTWAESFGGTASDVGYTVQQTSDGGFVVAGVTASFSGTYDAWVLKLSPSGVVEWQRAFGGGGAEEANSVQQTSDGGYVVAGYTTSFGAGYNDVWLLRLDASGGIQWQWAYGGGSADVASSVEQTTDGGYVVAGSTRSFGAGNEDVWVIKLGSAGSFEWQKAYGGANSELAHSIQQTADGGYIVAGQTASFGAGGWDVWVLKLDALGNIQSQWAYGGNGTDYGRSIRQTSDGGYIVGGLTSSFGAGNYDAWALKLSAVGDVQWDSVHGGNLDDQLHSIRQTSDGGYVAAGYREGSDVLVLKYDDTGAIQWQNSFSGGGAEGSNAVRQTTDGGYVVAGYTNSFGAGNNDVWVLKLNSAGALGGACTGVTQNANSLSIDTTGTATLQCSE